MSDAIVVTVHRDWTAAKYDDDRYIEIRHFSPAGQLDSIHLTRDMALALARDILKAAV